LLSHLADLREQASLYAEATADRVKLTVRQAAVRAALGCLALLAGAAVVITAAVLTLNGVAGGIGALLGDRIWAGQLITGVLILAALAAGAWWGAHSLTDSSRRKTLKKYERRHAQSLHAHAEAQRFRQGPPV